MSCCRIGLHSVVVVAAVVLLCSRIGLRSAVAVVYLNQIVHHSAVEVERVHLQTVHRSAAESLYCQKGLRWAEKVAPLYFQTIHRFAVEAERS